MLQLDVTKRLREFSLKVELALPAAVTVLLGPSGHGKTTVLNMIAGVVTPDIGSISLGGNVLFDSKHGKNLRMEQREVGFVFQDYALFPHMTVHDNVAYGLRSRGLKSQEINRRVLAELERMEIRQLAPAKPHALSAGQRQRVALARTLVTKPKAMLLDEPLSALDMQLRARVRGELRFLLKTLDIPTIVVTHDPLDAVGLADDVLVMEHGCVVQRGTYESLLAAPRSRFVADFVESNAFPAILSEWRPDGDSVVKVAPNVEIHVELDEPIEKLLAVIHPWDITLSLEPTASSMRNVLPATVLSVCGLRDRVRVLLNAGVPLAAEISRTSAEVLGLTEGSRIYASFKTTAVRVFRSH